MWQKTEDLMQVWKGVAKDRGTNADKKEGERELVE